MPMSSVNCVKPRRRAAGVLIAAVALAWCTPAARAALTCEDMPVLQPANAIQGVAADAQEKAELIRNFPPADRRHFIISQRQDLRAKYPLIDPLLLDRFLLWTTCEAIDQDTRLSPSQAFDEYSGLYRQLSEPIKAPAHAE